MANSPARRTDANEQQPSIAPPPPLNGLTINDILGTPPAGGYVVPGFSTDSSGNIVTTANQPDVQRQADNESNIRNAPADIDWANVYFGQFNLPSDLISQITALGQKYGTSNPDVFFQSAQNLVRGSDWFKTTFPGFDAGVRAGLFTDETGYRGYVNGLNGVYNQYLGRAVSGDETLAALTQGATPSLIGNQFQGDALAKTYGSQWQYLSGAFDENGALSSAEQTAYGREQAGIDTPLGQQVQKRIQLATARAQALFGGTLATPSLSLTQGRLSAPSLATTPDIAA